METTLILLGLVAVIGAVVYFGNKFAPKEDASKAPDQPEPLYQRPKSEWENATGIRDAFPNVKREAETFSPTTKWEAIPNTKPGKDPELVISTIDHEKEIADELARHTAEAAEAAHAAAMEAKAAAAEKKVSKKRRKNIVKHASKAASEAAAAARIALLKSKGGQRKR
jgi:hypothetical protein